MDSGSFAGTLLITLVIIAVIFLILREAVCWYWKINQGLTILTEIRDLLASQRVGMRSAQEVAFATSPGAAGGATAKAAGAAATEPTGTCPNCSMQLPLAALECPKCKASFGAGSAWKVQLR